MTDTYSDSDARPHELLSRTRVGHCKRDETDVYIGRGNGQANMMDTEIGDRGWLGNPYTVDEYDRKESIALFAQDLVGRLTMEPEFRDAVEELSGKTLGCWCQRVDEDEPACHGEVIAHWADKLATGEADL